MTPALPEDLRKASRAEAVQIYYYLLDQAKREQRVLGEMAWLGRADLFFLLTWMCGRKDMAAGPYGDWCYARCREVQANPNGYLDLWARYHFKSSIITFGLTLRDILREPEKTFCIFSNTGDLAEKFLGQIKREMEGNARLKQVYPDVLWQHPEREAPKWALDGITVRRRGNPKEATLEAYGLIDGLPTGAHYDVRIYDDVVTEKSVTNEEMVKKTTTQLDQSQNLGKEGGVTRYIGTRYHLADTYSEMIRRGMVRQRNYPATNNGHKDGTPVMFSQAHWDKVKIEQPLTYPAQMLLNPAAGNQGMFDLAWLKTFEVRPRTLNVYIMADPSEGKANKRSDRTAIAVIGVDSQANKYLLDGFRHRMKLNERWVALRDLYKKWSRMPGVKLVMVGYEKYGMQSDTQYFEEQMRLERQRDPKQAVSFTIQELSWTREGPNSKTHRVQRLVPDIVGGRLLLPRYMWTQSHPVSAWWIDADRRLAIRGLQGDTASMRRAKQQGLADCLGMPITRFDENRHIYDVTEAFIDEVTYFPFGQHDDFVDAASRIYDMEPVPPQVVHHTDLEPKAYSDGV